MQHQVKVVWLSMRSAPFNLLQATWESRPEAPFIHMSTNQVVEAFAPVEHFSGRCKRFIDVAENRIGDHSELRNIRTHCARWDITISLEPTIREIVENWHRKIAP
jgi:hypothetical protein